MFNFKYSLKLRYLTLRYKLKFNSSTSCYNSHRDLHTVLGIESSCDDTGVAVVNSKKQILGESLHNQGRSHREFGGIIPTLARDFHQQNIDGLVSDALKQAELNIQDVDAIAVSVKPGLTLSLLVGLEHAKALCHQHKKPLIPIHHMEAHALTARLSNHVEFPYLVMLMSGGHCLLAVVEGVDKFKLLGTCLDTSPGDMLDKTARRLKLKLLPELAAYSGGAAIEKLAVKGDPHSIKFSHVMSTTLDCNFSFAGLQFQARKKIEMEEAKMGSSAAGSVIPNLENMCASLQLAILNHMAKRLYRAFMFCDMKGLLPESNRSLVLSGGVASNLFIRDGLTHIANQFDCDVSCPPPRLCTDNGVMVAWNGVEKIMKGIDLDVNMDDIKVAHRSPLGVSMVEEVNKAHLKVGRIRFPYLKQETS